MTKEEAWKQYYESDPSLFDGGLDENDLAKIQQIFYDGYLAGAEPREKRIEELETRCTELFLQNNEFAERFEKSIVIIKGLLSCCRNYPQGNAEKMEQAEQFIKEIEK